MIYLMIDIFLITVQRFLICILILTGFNPNEVCVGWSTRTSSFQFGLSVCQRLTRHLYFIVKSARNSAAYWLNETADLRGAISNEAGFFDVEPDTAFSEATTRSTFETYLTAPMYLPISHRSPSTLTSFGRTLYNVLSRELDPELLDQSSFYIRDPTLEDVDSALLDEGDVTLELALLGHINEVDSENESVDEMSNSGHCDTDTCTTSSVCSSIPSNFSNEVVI